MRRYLSAVRSLPQAPKLAFAKPCRRDMWCTGVTMCDNNGAVRQYQIHIDVMANCRGYHTKLTKSTGFGSSYYIISSELALICVIRRCTRIFPVEMVAAIAVRNCSSLFSPDRCNRLLSAKYEIIAYQRSRDTAQMALRSMKSESECRFCLS